MLESTTQLAALDGNVSGNTVPAAWGKLRRGTTYM